MLWCVLKFPLNKSLIIVSTVERKNTQSTAILVFFSVASCKVRNRLKTILGLNFCKNHQNFFYTTSDNLQASQMTSRKYWFFLVLMPITRCRPYSNLPAFSKISSQNFSLLTCAFLTRPTHNTLFANIFIQKNRFFLYKFFYTLLLVCIGMSVYV